MLNAMSPMTLMWLVALILFGIAEAATVGLVSIWFAVGTIPALIVSALGGPVWLQVLLFLAVSILMLATLIPIVRRISAPRARTNADRHIGQTAIVTETIDNLAETGAVKLDGVIWSARSEDGDRIPTGSVITVKRITGVKVFVERAEKAETTSGTVS